MKRMVAFLLTVFMSISFLPNVAFAVDGEEEKKSEVTTPEEVINEDGDFFSENKTYGEFSYKINKQGFITILKYNGTDTDIIIPSVIEDKKVSTIAKGTFETYENIASITIPDSITSIEEKTFIKADTFTIVGSKDSYAESYALMNNYIFKDIHDESVHTFTSWKLRKKATEEVLGVEYRICEICGFEEVRELPIIENKEEDAEEVVENSLESIEIVKAPDDNKLIENADGEWRGDTFLYYVDPQGIQIKANYIDGTSEIFTYRNRGEYKGHQIVFQCNNHDNPWKVGKNTVTVSYFGRSTTYITEVVENPIRKIEVIELPDKNKYIVDVDDDYISYGEMRGLQLKIYYKDGREKVWEYNPDESLLLDGYPLYYELEGSKIIKGLNTIKLSYMGVKTSFIVEGIDSPVRSIELVSPPLDNHFIVGEMANLDGARLKINYTSGKSKEVILEENNPIGYWHPFEIMVDGYPCRFSFEKTTAVKGKNIINIEYLQAKTQYSVITANETIESIKIIEEPTASYGKGTKLKITNTDGESYQMYIKETYYYDYIGEGNHVEVITYIRTDQGLFKDVNISYDLKGKEVENYSITLLGKSNSIVKSQKFSVGLFVEEAMTHAISNDLNIFFNGEVNKDNIDSVALLSINNKDKWYEIYPYDEIPGDELIKLIKDMYEVEAVDLTLSKNYDSQRDVYFFGIMDYIYEDGQNIVIDKNSQGDWVVEYTNIYMRDDISKVTLIITPGLKIKSSTGGINRGIKLNKTSISLNLGRSEALIVTSEDGSAISNTSAAWRSSNTSIATVDSYGRITAKGEGTATITVKVSNKTATCTVTVNKTKLTLTDLFNYKYYADNNPDVRAAYGYKESELYKHFINYGMKEGRISSPHFDVKAYVSYHSDLNNAFGTDYISAYNHYINYGVYEGRASSVSFDPVYYLKNYIDLNRIYGEDYAAAVLHYKNYGYAEGRRASNKMSISGAYISEVPAQLYTGSGITPGVIVKDGPSTLVKGKDYTVSYSNNIKVGTAVVTITGSGNYMGTKTTTFTIRNYSTLTYKDLFNYKEYADSYKDLYNAYGYNESALYNHFVKYGMKEGRVGSKILDIKLYLESHSDLSIAFGKDYVAAYNHYIKYGIYEGRLGSNHFDVKYYLGANQDVRKAYGNDYAAALLHYINYGMKEGRAGKPGR